MKVILNPLTKDYLTLEGANVNYIFVAKTPDSNLCILIRERFFGGVFTWRILNRSFTSGNSYTDRYDSITGAVKEVLDINWDVHAFENWKDALTWLIANDR